MVNESIDGVPHSRRYFHSAMDSLRSEESSAPCMSDAVDENEIMTDGCSEMMLFLRTIRATWDHQTEMAHEFRGTKEHVDHVCSTHD
jgi:hypothetical protein